MALLTDSDVVTLAHLAAVDPELATVADSEAISVPSILAQSWTDAAAELRACTESFESAAGNVYGPTSVIVEESSPLVRWLIAKAVETFYRAASNRRTSDRYTEKLERAESETARAWRALYVTSIPLQSNPLSAPGAVHEIGSGGAWNGASTTAGGTGGDITRVVAITWTGANYESADEPNNAESGPSAAVTIAIPDNHFLRVSISGVNAPGSIEIPRGVPDSLQPRMDATGWNVYVGSVGGPLYLQNVTPHALTTTTVTFAADPVLSGSLLFSGQTPDVQTFLRRMALRG